jgi:hypothetical protein
MSYTPSGEELEEPVKALLEAIGPARDAMMSRIRSLDYANEHTKGLGEIVKELTSIELQILAIIHW